MANELLLDLIVLILGNLLPAGILLYTAYWALAIRQALVSRLYRNQALWLATECLLFIASGSLETRTSIHLFFVANGLVQGCFFLSIAAWADSTLRIARRSDPLLRSLLAWDKLRWVVLPLFGLLLIPFTYYSVTTGSIFNLQGIALLTIPWTASLFFLLLFILSTYGAVAFLIGAGRIRDAPLRGELKWISVFFASILGTFVPALLTTSAASSGALKYLDYSFSNIPSAIIVLVAYYALYRSARSLAPLNRITQDELAKMEVPYS